MIRRVMKKTDWHQSNQALPLCVRGTRQNIIIASTVRMRCCYELQMKLFNIRLFIVHGRYGYEETSKIQHW